MRRSGVEVALVADFVDLDVPDFFHAAVAVGRPAIIFIEAVGADVADESPEICLAKTDFEEMLSGGGDKGDADAAAPVIGIDIKSAQLGVVGKVGIERGERGGEADDAAAGLVRRFLDGDDGAGLDGICVREIVMRRAVFGAEAIEVVVGKDSAIAVLPCADVNARDGESICRNGWS